MEVTAIKEKTDRFIKKERVCSRILRKVSEMSLSEEAFERVPPFYILFCEG